MSALRQNPLSRHIIVMALTDKDGKVQAEVEDYMKKSIDSGHVMEMICSVEGLTYIEESLEKSDNVSVQPFDLKEDEGGFSLEGEIAGCL